MNFNLISSSLFCPIVPESRFYKNFLCEVFCYVPDDLNKTWLDVGCGCGELSKLAAKHGYFTTGIDNQAFAVGKTKKHLKKGLFKNLVSLKMDILNFNLVKYDIISASFLFSMLDEQQLCSVRAPLTQNS